MEGYSKHNSTAKHELNSTLPIYRDEMADALEGTYTSSLYALFLLKPKSVVDAIKACMPQFHVRHPFAIKNHNNPPNVVNFRL